MATALVLAISPKHNLAYSTTGLLKENPKQSIQRIFSNTSQRSPISVKTSTSSSSDAMAWRHTVRLSRTKGQHKQKRENESAYVYSDAEFYQHGGLALCSKLDNKISTIACAIVCNGSGSTAVEGKGVLCHRREKIITKRPLSSGIRPIPAWSGPFLSCAIVIRGIRDNRLVRSRREMVKSNSSLAFCVAEQRVVLTYLPECQAHSLSLGAQP